MTEAVPRPALEVIDKGSTSSTHSSPLLFVHGASHAAWCWDEHFLDFFADRGFRALALSLRGHGSSSTDKPLRRCSIADFVNDVDAVAAGMEAPPVVVGHSMGGLVVQRYLERQRSPAGVLMASVPVHGLAATSGRLMRRHPLLAMRCNISRRTELVFKAMPREALFSISTPEDIVTACADRVESESTRALWFDAMFRLPKPSRVAAPVLVLGAEHDGCFTTDEVHATARAYRTKAQIFPGMGHNMMLEPGWPVVAERIESWLREHGL